MELLEFLGLFCVYIAPIFILFFLGWHYYYFKFHISKREKGNIITFCLIKG